MVIDFQAYLAQKQARQQAVIAALAAQEAEQARCARLEQFLSVTLAELLAA